MDAILATYPLSAGFQKRLGSVIDPAAIRLSLSELRTLPPVAMLRHLRTLNVNKLVIPLEDESSAALLPILKLVASVVPARSYLVIDDQMRSSAFTRLGVPPSLAQLVQASAASRLAIRRAAKEAALLLAAPRMEPLPLHDPGVLFLNANLWFGVKAGGSVGHISGVVNGFLDLDYGVDYLSVGGRLLVDDRARYLPLTPPAHFGLPWEANYYRFHFSAVREVGQVCRERKSAFIYQRMSIANYTGVSISRQHKLPLILEYNGSEAWIARNWGRPLRYQSLAEQIEAVCLRHAHLVVTVSDVLRDELMERGIPADRIVSYPNCIDPETFDPARHAPTAIAALRQRHAIAPDAIVATFVGTFGQWHGAPVLAQAARTLLDRHADWVRSNKLHFLFVGDGLRMPEVRSALGDHQSGPAVTLTGLVPQSEAPLYLAASDILCSPHVANTDGSKFFGSPTKLFEYMAMGKAIIASDLDQIGEVLAGSPHVRALAEGQEPRPDQPALLATPGSSEDIVAGLRFLAGHPAWRQALGANARRLALAKYTWRHHVEAILEGAARNGLIETPPRAPA
jgi:glycosyltransferase involved in cell wall biosynthesis